MKIMKSANTWIPNNGGTLRYRAPELLDLGKRAKEFERKPSSKSDVYSLSMVIVEVCTLCGM